MTALAIALLVTVLIGQIIILLGLGGVAYLCYKTLVRPEAPCYAAAMPMLPRIGAVEVDPSHPAYNELSKIIAKKQGAAPDKGGNYL